MFSDTVTKRLITIDNEQRAQKTAALLNYGSLTKPSSVPVATWSGAVKNAVDVSAGMNARWIATFTRNDGIDSPPLVDFPWSRTIGKGNYKDQIDAGYIISANGRDREAIDEIRFSERLWKVGSNYVSWAIEIGGNNGAWYYVSSDGTTVSLTVTAVSMVGGTLSLVRTV